MALRGSTTRPGWALCPIPPPAGIRGVGLKHLRNAHSNDGTFFAERSRTTIPRRNHSANMIARVARYALPLAILCALAAIGSGIGYRLGWWPLGVGFGILRWAAYVAIVATALAVAAVVVARRSNR